MRSNQPTAVEPGSLPALPGPSRPMRLSDAFGRGAGGSGVTLSAPAPTVPDGPTDPAMTNPAPTNPAPTNPAPPDPAVTNPAPSDPG